MNGPSDTTPLRMLVFFLTGLALFGSLLAVGHYYAWDLPMQQANPPGNWVPGDEAACARCMGMCALKIWDSSCPANCFRCECSQYECADR
ncbi:MAG: hypothetical protein GYA23_10250 [Methanomicrobiales archaeon]|nr:hypothetical protein [Methanomicrobiales archaeon]